MRENQIEEIADAFATLFKPRPNLTVVEWAESQLSLDTTMSAMAGPFSTAVTPYTREILDSFANPNIKLTVCCFGAQTSKTQTYQAGLAWTLANAPSPTMWVMPNKNLAESFAETRCRPFIFSSAEVSALRIPKKREKKTEIILDGALLTLVGSNSPANLSSRPVRVLILDEVDKFPLKTKKEADALSLAIERTRSFPEPKIFESSTPTTAEGQIWNEFLNGDQRRFFVPCPKCGKEILLVFNPARTAFEKLLGCEAKLEWAQDAKRDGGEWDYARVKTTAHFACPHCGAAIYNGAKTKMLRGGHWRATNTVSDAHTRSYHLPTFYAPWTEANWGELAVEFLKAKKKAGGLRNFINSVCAEPDMGQWDGGGATRRELIVLNPTDENKPKERARIMTVDRQKDYFYWLIREWYVGGDSELVAWGKADTFDDLKAIADKNGVRVVGVDNGFEAVDTNKNCARFGFFAMRGDGRESWPYYDKKKRRFERPWTMKRIDPLIGTRDEGRKYVYEIMWSNPSVKDLVSSFREPKTSPVRWAIPQTWATEEYFQHLNGEYKKRVVNPKTGRTSLVWMLRSSSWPNHLLDCECMNAAFALYFEILKTATEGSENE